MKYKILGLLPMIFLVISTPSIVQGEITQDIVVQEQENTMPNVIFMIGDGMGGEQIKAASLIEYGNATLNIMDQEFDFQGIYGTDDITGTTTDSAAGGTALSTGQLTKNGRVGMDEDAKISFKNILELLKNDFGYSTGIVTTTEISHATPAVFSSHTHDREQKTSILKQQLSQDISVLLGGGQDVSYIGSADIVKNLGVTYGYDTAINLEEMKALQGTSDRLLGVFPVYNIPYELERDIEKIPSLIEMTDAALNVLKRQDSPYFLMIEGGRIDHAGHLAGYNEYKTLYNVMETIIFEKTVKLVIDEAKADGNTIVIVGADHETGGLQVLDFSNLDTILPSDNNTRDENNLIRSNRVDQLSVSWKWESHSNTPVRFFGYGFETRYDIKINTDVFWALVNELGNFPVVKKAVYVVGTSLNAEILFRDTDSSSKKIEFIVKYSDTDEIISKIVDLPDYNVNGSISYEMPMNTSRAFRIHVKILDGNYDGLTDPAMDLSTTSLISGFAPVTVSSEEETSVFYLAIIFPLVLIPILRRKK